MFTAGIDAGSRTVKVVVLRAEDGAVLGRRLADQGIDQEHRAMGLLESLLAELGLKRADIAALVATGYGRCIVHAADANITEITCQAAGVHHVLPATRTILEIGGQDSKLIRLTADGRVADFAMNDRCAAGTGRFLESAAALLAVSVAELGELAGRCDAPAAISNMCAVFAETEIVGLLASGTDGAAIAAGVQAAVATRLSGLGGHGLQDPVVLAGGVALIPNMAAAIGKALRHEVVVAPQAQYTGAIGAAVLAARRV